MSIDQDAIRAIANAMQIGEFSELNENPNLVICKSATPTLRKFSNEDWIREQKSRSRNWTVSPDVER